jgi:STE24 endopeptidase
MQSAMAAGFSTEEVERARLYHRPLYRLLAADLAVSFGLLGALSFSTAGEKLNGALGDLPWWGRALAFPALVLSVSQVVRLPLSFWRGYVHEHRYGFSTQTVRGWLGDRLKALAIGAPLTALPLFGLVATARALPGTWPAIAAPGASLLVVFLGFLAPVLLEPVFNRFSPLEDAELARDLRLLAERAGVPVRDVLVADASRRTKKLNAYVSGLGRTRRVVLYDTLLERSTRGEIELVTAHELAHRRERHVLKSTALAAAGAAAAVLVIWRLLSNGDVLAALGAFGAGDPRIAPFVLLIANGLELIGAPLGSAISRRWERAADRVSLVLTGDRASYVAVHRGLATQNLADLDPPRFLYYVFFSHPTPPERLLAAPAGNRED